MVSENNLDSIIDLLGNEEVDPKVRLALAETLVVITKSLGFRKSFLRTKFFDVLAKIALRVVEDRENPTEQLIEISSLVIQVLIQVNSLTSNRVYIPGESKISERLRKCSFDSGTYFLFAYIFASLKDTESLLLKPVVTLVQDRYMASIDISDLMYNQKVLNAFLNPQPVVEAVSH